MRTTLTIDDDLAGLLRARSRELGKPFKAVVNQALRRGLAEGDGSQVARRVITRPKALGLRPGIDPDRLNQLCDELEVEEYLEKGGGGMILPDVNLLLYAHNTLDPKHGAARRWWDECLAGPAGIGLAWVVILGFVRLSTHPRVFADPFHPEEALERVAEWLSLPHVSIIHPSAGHLARFTELISRAGAAGNLTTDAHLAALAMERGLVLHTTDADFTRFQGLKWRNPLSDRG